MQQDFSQMFSAASVSKIGCAYFPAPILNIFVANFSIDWRDIADERDDLGSHYHDVR